MIERAITWLYLKWLWLRSSYTFQWAHKPLCDRFHHDVIRLGPVHLCRSCTCLYVGVAIAVVACRLLADSLLTGWVATSVAAALMLTLALSSPNWYWRWPRTMRDVLRFSAGASSTIALFVTFAWNAIGGTGVLLSLIVFWMWYFRIRETKKQTICQGCPELGSNGICSGFIKQARLIRSYEEQATQYLNRARLCFKTHTNPTRQRGTANGLPSLTRFEVAHFQPRSGDSI